MSACTYEREVGYRPFLAGFENGSSPYQGGSMGTLADRKAPPPPSLWTEQPGGKIVLHTPQIRALLINTLRTLSYGEDDLFDEYLVSRRLAEECDARGLEVMDAFESLRARLPELVELVRRMPLAEYSPSVRMEPIGNNVFDLNLIDDHRKGVKLTSVQVAFERGAWRLVWVRGVELGHIEPATDQPMTPDAWPDASEREGTDEIPRP